MAPPKTNAEIWREIVNHGGVTAEKQGAHHVLAALLRGEALDVSEYHRASLEHMAAEYKAAKMPEYVDAIHDALKASGAIPPEPPPAPVTTSKRRGQ